MKPASKGECIGTVFIEKYVAIVQNHTQSAYVCKKSGFIGGHIWYAN